MGNGIGYRVREFVSIDNGHGFRNKKIENNNKNVNIKNSNI